MHRFNHIPLKSTQSKINYIKDVDISESVDSNIEEQVDEGSSSDNEPDSKIFDEVVNIAGCWGTHTFERHPWSERKRPRIFIKEFDDIKLDENETAGILSERMIGTCLSYLERSPQLLHYAYAKCILSGKDLVDITPLKKYNYIQYLDLSNNNLNTLEALGQLPFLQFLDASYNKLETLLDFRAPYYLSHVNYNHNLVSELPDLSQFWSITYLKVANNNISQIKGLENLKFLTHLNLSYNKITVLENLNNLRITTLILSHNLIETFKENEEVGFHTLSYLKTVDLSNNKLKNLRIFKGNEQLEKLLISHNAIASMLELYYLNQLRYLINLNLVGNPLTHLSYYYRGCLNILNRLKVLDDVEIRAEKRVEARFSGEIDPTIKARENRMDLLLLQHINDPKIGTHIFPYDQPPPQVMMIVGPVGSKKKELALEFVKANRKAVLGINYTTRPPHTNETHGKQLYFISEDEFRTMVRNGGFIAVSESYGHYFGIAYKELEKGENAVIVFCSDITSALTLKIMGICPKIVLAIPRREETHLEWLKDMYFFECLDHRTIKIKNCPESAGAVMMTSEHEISNTERTSDMNALEEESSSDEKDDNIEGNLHICQTQEYDDEERNVYFQTEDNVSDCYTDGESKRFSSEFDLKQMQQSSKSYTGILKNRSSIMREACKLPAVSFQQDSPCLLNTDLKKELSSKRVSFNWFPSIDWFDDDFILDHTHGSISESCLHSTNMSKEKYDNEIPILSALSSNRLTDEFTDTKETVYINLNKKFEQLQADNLKIFFKNVMKTRYELLELHWGNPGLFRDIIFTDDTVEALAKLKELLKFTVEHHKDAKQIVSFDDDPIFEKILKSKLENLKLQDNIYVENFS